MPIHITRAMETACTGVVVMAAICLAGCHTPRPALATRWHERHAYVSTVPPITFHYDHGVLAGSYPENVETVAVEFDDVCAQLGHVCLCGAGGFRIAGKVVDALSEGDAPPERGGFLLISSRDHTVSDVIAFVLGCSRRADPERSQYFIDDSITAPRREYHYYIAYPPARAAVRVVYRKHLLIGHDAMDSLWKIELAFDHDPDSVSAADAERYRMAMLAMVQDALFDRVPGLITVEPVAYEEFQQRLNHVRE